jgi:hypothetical protein
MEVASKSPKAAFEEIICCWMGYTD